MRKNISKIIFVVFCLALFFTVAEVARSPQTGKCELYFFDVGQGDSELIQFGDYQILIDGGPDDTILSELGRVMPIMDRKIDLIILSHPHADHLAGLNLVIDRYEVGKIYSGGVLDTTSGYLEFLNNIKTKNINFVVADFDSTILPFADSKLTFLWPGKNYQSQKIDNLNNSSLVAKFCYFDSCALFTGDIETEEQSKMLSYYRERNKENIFASAIYKMPHHGSNNGVNENLIKLVNPRFAIIEVGMNNSYGHPHASTLELLKNLNIETLRTDKDGAIKFLFSSEGIRKD